MRTKSPVVADVIRTLYRSLGMDMIFRVSKNFIEGYNVNQRMGFPPSVPVPAQDAANRVVLDLLEAGFFMDLVEWLVRADRQGVMGKKYPIVGIDEIIQGMEQEGYLLDPESGLFYEDPRRHRTPGWGRLKAGEEYPITLLKLDIVRNSRLVRGNDSGDIAQAYDALRDLVRRIVEKRRGRIWLWEGDGGLAAFRYGHPNMSAVLCGMEILNELLVFNMTANPLDRDIRVRLAAHAGFIRYTEDQAEMQRSEIVKETTEIEEAWTPPDTLCVSASIAPHVDGIIKDCLVPLEGDCPRELLGYRVAARQAAKTAKGRGA